MSELYQKFQGLDLDTSCIGLMTCEDNTPYFCTPVGMQIIGWAGVDGIHFGFIKGFGEMVFAINPMTCCDRYVHPLAANFSDFLRLVLATNGTTALEQIVLWDKQRYLSFMRSSEEMEYAAQDNVSHVLRAIRSLGVTPMEQPFEYVKRLQAEFDYSRLVFSDEYYDVTGAEKPAP